MVGLLFKQRQKIITDIIILAPTIVSYIQNVGMHCTTSMQIRIITTGIHITFYTCTCKNNLSPTGMFCRAALAAIDWNSNLTKNQVNWVNLA